MARLYGSFGSYARSVILHDYKTTRARTLNHGIGTLFDALSGLRLTWEAGNGTELRNWSVCEVVSRKGDGLVHSPPYPPRTNGKVRYRTPHVSTSFSVLMPP